MYALFARHDQFACACVCCCVYVLTIPPTIHSDGCVLSTRPLFVVGCVGIYGKSHREIDKSDNRCGCKMISGNLSKNETVAFYCNGLIHSMSSKCQWRWSADWMMHI